MHNESRRHRTVSLLPTGYRHQNGCRGACRRRGRASLQYCAVHALAARTAEPRTRALIAIARIAAQSSVDSVLSAQSARDRLPGLRLECQCGDEQTETLTNSRLSFLWSTKLHCNSFVKLKSSEKIERYSVFVLENCTISLVDLWACTASCVH